MLLILIVAAATVTEIFMWDFETKTNSFSTNFCQDVTAIEEKKMLGFSKARNSIFGYTFSISLALNLT